MMGNDSRLVHPTRDFVLLSDGERVLIVAQDYIYIVHDTLLKSLDLNFQRDILDVTAIGESRKYIHGKGHIDLDFSLAASHVDVQERRNIVLGRDLFQRLTILDLFAWVDRAIKDREG